MFNMMQKVYDVQVVKRIIGDDGKPKLVTLNQKVPNEKDAAIAKVLNDVTTGEYDFVMEVGPGYNTKREEGLDAMLEILPTPLGEIVAQTAGDLVVRMMDAPGADMIADRMQAANPLAQTDEESDVPPAAQMQIKALQGKLEEAGKVIQGLEIEKKSRIDVEKVKQDGATKRTLMQETGAAHTEQIRQEGTLAVENAENLAWMHDVAVKAQTSLSVAEINALAKLLTTNSQIEASDRAGERQIAAKADEAREKTET
jgi:Flp pilus assembly secretin CpaC